MKNIISICLMFTPVCVIAQNTDSIIQNIRTEVRTIVDNTEKYKKVVIDVSPQELFLFDNEGDQPNIERKITYHIEENEMKLVSVSSEYTFLDTELEIVEYYLKNNKVLFIFQQYKKLTFPDEYQWEIRTTKIIERRIYYDSNQTIRCLTKIAEGKLSEINDLLQKAPNKEEDCSQMWNIGGSLIYIYNEENIDVLFEHYRNHVDSTNSTSKERINQKK